MPTVTELSTALDNFHRGRLSAADSARLGVELERMECTDLLTAGSWVPDTGFFAGLFDRTTLVWTNVRGLFVGIDQNGNVYKIDCPLGTWYTTTYSTADRSDYQLPRRETLERAQLRCEAHRLFLRHMAATTSAG